MTRTIIAILLFVAFAALAFGHTQLAAAERVSAAQLADELESSETPTLVDVRKARDYERGHIPGAINLDLRDLRVRNLPPLGSVVVYGDGLGLQTGKEAAQIIAERTDWDVRVLAGGYTGWQTARGRTTEASGLHTEDFNRATYNQLLEADLSEAVLVDLGASGENGEGGASPVAFDDGAVADFARQLGVPRTRRDPFDLIPGGSGASPASSGPGPALILVDANDGGAREAARRLRVRGYHRVLILIGGDEAVRFKGKTGKGRTATSLSFEGEF
jgi:rhodanese-related sulfurtransferase